MKQKIIAENGFFVTLEGPEGAGKSTQGRLLAEALRQKGYDVLETREPGGTPLGEQLRHLIKHFGDPESVCPQAELLMFGASRAQLMQNVVLPHLHTGGIVICDRFADSTTVYQGCARELDPAFIEQMHQFTIGNRWPDLTLLLDLHIDTGFRRSHARSGSTAPSDRIEAEPNAFHTAVRNGFLKLAHAHPERIKTVDASASAEVVHQEIMEIVARALG